MKSSTLETICTPKIIIQRQIWSSLILKLRERGSGERESGAFLLADQGSNIITHFICYDDIDPCSLDSGIIIFEGQHYSKLWAHCRNHNRQVLVDVHTHPGRWTLQSNSDKAHPMMLNAGHIALIVPCFAKKNLRSLKGVGCHEYLGDYKWRTHPISSSIISLQ